MQNKHYLLSVVEKQKRGIAQGVFSVCSANEFVIEAALEFGKEKNTTILIEATSNQVNQFGGYTGMKPAQFAGLVFSLAEKTGLPPQSLLLGGDHLGPNPWQKEPAQEAMAKAITLVEDYVAAGFNKIHLDASMYLGDDRGDRTEPLDPKVVAERTAQLGQAAEKGYDRLLKVNPRAVAPVYVVGSEVPVPGGVQEDHGELKVTDPDDFRKTVTLTKEAFYKNGLDKAWARVVGVVVQPGVEFGDESIDEYNPAKARVLAKALKEYPNVVFEGHSTDYQQPHRLKQMVADGVGILKVGPELTFAYREALFLLHHIEQELLANSDLKPSRLVQVVEETMLEQPENWQPYYGGTETEQRFARKYSFSDRIRYYWPQPRVARSVELLLANLASVEIPLTLLSQYFPVQYAKIRAGKLNNAPEALIKDRIKEIYEKYFFATEGN